MTLKTKNTPYLVGLLLLLYVGFALANRLDWSFIKVTSFGANGISLANPLLTLLFYLVVLVLSFLLPSDLKHQLVFCRLENPLPGSRIFTSLMHTDSRISPANITKQYGKLPSDPVEQNRLWYRIYKEKQKDAVVSSSHGRWLLFRDSFALTLLLLVPASAFTFWKSGLERGLVFMICLLAIAILLMVCARNAANRFACNVLAR